MKPESPTLLIIGYVWPEPGSSAAGSRMMQLISLFRQAGWEITFASSAAESDHAVDLEELGVEEVGVEINSSAFDRFVEELQPEVVMFDRFVVEEQFGWRVARHCPEALRLLDTEDLHCLRRARRSAINEDRPFEEGDLLASDVAKREVASILRCDLSLIISEYEMELLNNFFRVDRDLLYYLPFLLDSIGPEQTEEWPVFDEREHFVTIGNFRHPPNRDGVRYLHREIWPLIRKELPKAELHVYGAYPSQKVWDLHNPEEGFRIRGRAADAASVVRQARVCLAPLRFGAGLKGKLVEAMQCGTPSVTTDIGAEGLNGKLDWSGAVANDPETIAQVAVKLYRDRKSWKEAQQRGIKIINSRFGKKQFEADFMDHVGDLLDRLPEHRRQNFTGRMLMHHTMASTEYMSRWIEAKNRPK